MGEGLRGLYVITAGRCGIPGRSHLEIAEAALKAGARIVQFRDKQLSISEAVALARVLRQLTRSYQSLLIINDNCEVAGNVQADGVHLGQDDLSIEAARALLGRDSIIGVSVDTTEEAEAAHSAGADYVSIGPIYPTGTKTNAGPVVGPEAIRKVKERVPIPVAAIGGIEASNIIPVVKTGADMVCVISAVANAEDMVSATRRLIEMFEANR